MASIIGVNEIQHTNGTTAATIDSSGRMTKNVITAFRASGSNSYVAVASGGTVLYNDVTTAGRNLYNEGGHFNTSTSTFTAPVDGIYNLQASVLMQSESQGGIRIRVTKASDSSTQDQIGYNWGRQVTAQMFAKLEAGDTVKVLSEEADSFYLGTYGSFQGYLVG